MVSPRVEAATHEDRTLTLDLLISGTGALSSEPVWAPPEGQNVFYPGDVLFGKLRPYLAKSLLVRERINGTGELLCMTPGPSIDNRYLLYTTLSRPWLEYADLTSYGSKMPRTSWETMSRFALPDIDLLEQRRIADFLQARIADIDAAMSSRRHQRELLARAYESFVGQAVDIAGREGTVSLRRLSAGVEQGWSPVAESEPASASEPGVLKLGSVRGGHFRPAENKALSDGTDPDERYLVRTGDLLVTRANTVALVGDAAVAEVDEGARLYLSDLIYRVVLVDVDPHFVSFALRAPNVRQLLATLARGTSRSMAKLRGGDLLTLPLPDVSRARQRELGAQDRAERESTRVRQADLDRSIALLTEYKQALITAAVSGEIDVTTAGGLP